MYLRGHNRRGKENKNNRNLLDAIFSKLETQVIADVEHLIWTGGSLNNSGYPTITVRTGKTMGVHVVMWEFYNKIEVPTGLEVDHKCKIKRCVRDIHLEAVTSSVNLRRRNFYIKKRF